jgi:hypothetical protein
VRRVRLLRTDRARRKSQRGASITHQSDPLKSRPPIDRRPELSPSRLIVQTSPGDHRWQHPVPHPRPRPLHRRRHPPPSGAGPRDLGHSPPGGPAKHEKSHSQVTMPLNSPNEAPAHP